MKFLRQVGSRFSQLTSARFSTNCPNVAHKTCLYDLHVSNGAKMVPYAGFQLPMVYEGHNITSSHIHTRHRCSLFDVSHMLQSRISGPDSSNLLEALTVADVQGLGVHAATLSLFTNAQGGILDDLIITKASPTELLTVTNAGCRDKDMSLMLSATKEFRAQGKDVKLEFLENQALIALQGPESSKVLQELVNEDLSSLTFMTSCIMNLSGFGECRITRCGYTGEDGFEISLPATVAPDLARRLLSSKAGQVKLAGLGARDSLRLEAGLCLYGNDISEASTPMEAGLTWTIGKRRRIEAGFPGDEIVLEQLAKKRPLSHKRVGFLSQGPPARTGAPILDLDTGRSIGTVTSGCPSPSNPGFNVAMGYIKPNHAKIGTKVLLEVRKKKVEATITKMPFVKANYYTKA